MSSIGGVVVEELEPLSAGDFSDDGNGNGSKDGVESGFLQELGLVGLEELELPILCSLVTGDPLLMVGKHGTAKTALAAVLAGALGQDFHAYDASKALFEDIIGFPNPDALGRGKLDYVPTSISLWDKSFILIDEISRANPQTQSKWLEVIRSRRLMGKKLNRLKYIFSAMNPPGDYQGAMPLDPALAGRFAFIIEMPSLAEMSLEERFGVIGSVGSDDAPLSTQIFKRSLAFKNQTGIEKSIKKIRSRLESVIKQYGPTVDNYLSSLIDAVSVNEEELKQLDGRRLGMMRRNILVALAANCPSRPRAISSLFKKILLQSLPHSALGKELPVHTYELAHYDAFASAVGGESEKEDNRISGQELLNRALEYDTPQEALPALAALARVFKGYIDGSEGISADSELVGRIIGTGRAVLNELSLERADVEVVEKYWCAKNPHQALAALMLGWWFVEKNSTRGFTSSPFLIDQSPALIAELEKRLKK